MGSPSTTYDISIRLKSLNSLKCPQPHTYYTHGRDRRRKSALTSAGTPTSPQLLDASWPRTVRLVLDEGKTVAGMARDLGLTESSLRNWVEHSPADSDQGQDGLTTAGRSTSSFRFSIRAALAAQEGYTAKRSGRR